jgi:hypothetical protein
MTAPGMPPMASVQGSFAPVLPPSFQALPNMPNINFAAPVIRLGTTGPGKPTTPMGSEPRREDTRGARAGLGLDSQRQRHEPLQQIHPPTKDEVLRTVFVGGITDGTGGDAGVERILRSAGNLKKWIRAIDADEKPCKFGFAEYEDVDSLATAIEVLKDVMVPVERPKINVAKKEEDEDEEKKVEKSALVVRTAFLDEYTTLTCYRSCSTTNL